ncbi:ASCH domain-containing protein [Paenibacillus massiliensis]|uniref:ASCH domain-containing protein n=1 Tax=Paenibacillus massiliensis TaxID=225917 RepID=UPI00049167E8|nr:ASCH domain-containing protein [Paenibacillus massiliensis]
MKAVTVWQPWATLLAVGEKTNETKPRRTHHRGPLAIHAAKHIDRAACEVPEIKAALARHGYTVDNLPTGAVVAICDLKECWSISRLSGWGEFVTPPVQLTADNNPRTITWSGKVENNKEYLFGNYDDGRFAWEMAEVLQLTEPIPAKGQQGMWNWEKGDEV